MNGVKLCANDHKPVKCALILSRLEPQAMRLAPNFNPQTKDKYANFFVARL
jgi:hypothetical protein